MATGVIAASTPHGTSARRPRVRRRRPSHQVPRHAQRNLFGPTADFVSFLRKFQKVSEAMFYFANPAAKADTPTKREMKRLNDLVFWGLAYLPSEGNHVHVRKPTSGPVQAFAIVTSAVTRTPRLTLGSAASASTTSRCV